MDLFKIFSEIEKIDGEVYERFDTRRRAFKHLAGLGKTVTAATMPALLSTMFNKAYGQTTTALTPEIIATLNLALQLEYLELYYYTTGLNTPGLIPANEVQAITIIRDDEQGHVNALRAVLGTNAIPDPTRAAFDYTGRGDGKAGVGGDPFSATPLFYGTAQGFVDTGVRAYKGGAASLMPNKDILQAALNIHSVEARHSSHIRAFRRGGAAEVGEVSGGAGNLRPKSWVSLVENGGPAPAVTAAVYNAGTLTDTPAENNLAQGSVTDVQSITTAPTIPGVTPDLRAAVSEAFDEPLDAAAVRAIARNFRSPVGAALRLFDA